LSAQAQAQAQQASKQARKIDISSA